MWTSVASNSGAKYSGTRMLSICPELRTLYTKNAPSSPPYPRGCGGKESCAVLDSGTRWSSMVYVSDALTIEVGRNGISQFDYILTHKPPQPCAFGGAKV